MLNLNELHEKLSPPLRFALAGAVFALAFVLRIWAIPVESGLAFMTFYPAMIICFYLFGIGPGIFAAVLSASVGHFIFIPPYWTFFAFSQGDIAVVDFLMSTALIGFVINQLQNYSRQALNSLVDLNIAATAFKSDEGMLITDDQGVILRVNQAFTQSTGYTAEEVVGQNPRIFKSGRHDAAFYREMWDAIKTTGTWQGEIWDRRKNGEIYPKWLTITAVKGDDGVITHYVGIHVDITAQNRLEEDREHLFNEVRELSRRLIQIQEQERQAIALTLHDDIGQSLTAIKAYASSITHYCHLEDLDRVLLSANEVNQISTGLLKTVRNQLRDLRPGYLKELGLKGALKNLCESWENSGAIACDLKITGAVDELPEDVQVQLFRIVQEGLTNVARHAAASTASVELSTGSHGSKLGIADDGRGFDPATTVHGIGLVGMRERAFAIGGLFDLNSAPGAGTQISIRFQGDPDREIL